MFVKKVGKGWKDRLVCEDDAGNIRHIQAAWTDYLDSDSNSVQSEASALAQVDFRLEDLIMLAKLMCDMGKV